MRLDPRACTAGAVAIASVLAAAPVRAEESPAQRLDELLSVRVSTASKLDHSAMRAPGSVVVVTAEDIERYGYTTLGEVLQSVAGFTLTYDRNYDYLGVRGFNRPSSYNNRVLLLLDGFRVNEDVYGSAPFGSDLPIDLRAVDRIEIARGPGSAAFGGAAMFAVINVILRKAAGADSGVVAIEGGSFGAISASAREAVEGKHGFGVAWSVKGSDAGGDDLYYEEYDSPDTHNGITRDTDWERAWGLTAAASLGEVKLTALATSRDKGIPTGSFETDFGDRDAASLDAWLLLGAQWERAIGRELSLSAKGSVGTYRYEGVYPSEGVRYEDESTNDFWALELAAKWTPGPAQRVLAGVEMRDNTRADYRSFDDEETVYFDGDFPYEILSLYVEHEIQVTDRLLLSAGLRYDDYSRGGTNSSPRLAAVILPTDRDALKLIYGEAFRPPNIYEMFYADEGLAKANPDLDPERVETFEIEWQRRWTDALMGTLSLYRSEIDDLIDQEIDPADEQTQFRNIGSARSEGIEWEVRARAGARFTAYASAGLQETEGEDGRRLTNSPEKLFKAGVSASRGRGWTGALELLHESQRRTVQETETDPITLLGGKLCWTSKRRPFSVSLRVKNLLDERYFHPAGFEHRQSSIEQDGRTFLVRFDYHF